MASLVFYLISFLIIFIVSSIGSSSYQKNKSKGKFLIILSFVLITCILGFRYYVGTDYEAYMNYFNVIKYCSWSNLFSLKWEYGALIFFKVSSIFIDDPRIIFFLIGLLTLYPIYKTNQLFDFKYLSYSLLCFLMLYLPFSMNGMRQAIAMGFILYSFMLLIKKHNVKSVLFMILAILFHKTAILFVPFMILYKVVKDNKYSKYSFILSIFLSVIILFFLRDFFADNDILTYSTYLNNIDINNISIKPLLFYLPSILIIMFFDKKDANINKLNGLYYSGILFNLVGTAARYLNRISYYFSFFEIILIPYLIYNINNKKTRKIIKLLYIVYLILYFIIQFYVGGKQEIFPYRTWLSN